jgi:Uma2 family endonuclease
MLGRMTTARQLRFSYEDYLAALEDSELKLEYCEGVIYAMAGGTLVHAELGLSVGSVLRRALPRCSVFSSDAKLLHYQRLPSVKAVLFISHQERRITVVERTGEHWVTRDVRAGERVALTDPACEFGVDEVYGGVILEP